MNFRHRLIGRRREKERERGDKKKNRKRGDKKKNRESEKDGIQRRRRRSESKWLNLVD